MHPEDNFLQSRNSKTQELAMTNLKSDPAPLLTVGDSELILDSSSMKQPGIASSLNK